MPEHFVINDNMIVPAGGRIRLQVEVVRGPNIKPFPLGQAAARRHTPAKVVLKVGDNITTDHIMPAGAKLLPYRSNVPYLLQLLLHRRATRISRPAARSRAAASSSAAQTTVRARPASMRRSFRCIWASRRSCAKSFARIHKANLVNSGILPLTFADPADYDAINLLDEMSLPNVRRGSKERRAGHGRLRRQDLQGRLRVSERQRHAAARGRHAALRASAGEQVELQLGRRTAENACPVRLDRMTLIC